MIKLFLYFNYKIYEKDSFIFDNVFGFIGNLYASDYIIYSNSNDGGKIYRKDANDTGNGIAINNVASSFPTYSPDGNYIIYTNSSLIYRKDANTLDNGSLINSDFAFFPSYSPNSQYIIYINMNDGGKIYRKNANDTGKGVPINNTFSWTPIYSPDGQYIIYINGGDGNKIYRKNANDTGNGNPINNISSGYPTYSPDGQYIIYTNGGDGNKIYRKNASDAENGNPTNTISSSFPHYSPDGQYIIYINGGDGNKIYRKNASDRGNGGPINNVSSSFPHYSNISTTSNITNLKQYIKLPEAPTLEKQEIPPATKVGKYQSGSGIILSAYVENSTNTQLRLEFEIYRLGAPMPSIQLNTNYFLSGTGEVVVPYLGVGEYYWKVRTKSANGITSDWVDYNTNYPWEYDYTFFEGFEPYPYGYKFENSSPAMGLLTGGVHTNIFPFPLARWKTSGNKWDIFESAFDLSNFEPNSMKIYDAFEHVGLNKWDALTGGNCYGMAVSSLMHYRYPSFLQTYHSEFLNQIGTGTIWDKLSIPNTVNGRWNQYNDTVKAILAFQTSQFSVHQSEIKNNSIMSNANDILIKYSSNPNKHYVLSFWGIKPSGDAAGHTVIPYKLEGNKLYFWDNNFPYPIYDNISAYNMYIQVNLDGTWTIPTYSYFSQYGPLALVNIDDIYNRGQKSSPGGFNGNDTSYVLSGKADLYLEDTLGRKSGFLQGNILEEIPGVNVIIPYNLGNEENTWKQIYLPQKQNLTVKVVGRSQENYDLMIAGGDYYTKLEGVQTYSGQLDNFISTRENLKIDFDNSKEGSYNLLIDNFYNNGTGTIFMHSMPSIGEKQLYTMNWNKVINNANDSVLYGLDLNNDGIYETEQNLPPMYQYFIPTMTRQPILSEDDKNNEDK